VDNAWIADRLEALAALLDLADANPYTVRAYRRAAETVRGAALPVAELVGSGRARELRGIGPGIEARLQELVATGEIAELAELEREFEPGLVGIGRYLGLSARKSIDIARALGVRTADELREAALAGRLRDVPGVGPKTEAQIREALAQRFGAVATPSPGAGSAGSFSPPRPSSSRASRTRSAASRPATCGGDAIAASGSRSCARRAMPRPCWIVSLRYRRSSPCSNAANAARLA
jgi:predicted flap endonuclease-1-like 5' DNA nuclease